MRFRILPAFLLTIAFIQIQAQNPANIFKIPNRTVTVPCGGCVNITASVPHLKQSTDYIVTSHPYLPYAYVTSTGIDATSLITSSTVKDDRWTPKLPIGFPFCFYGITYPTMLLGTNAAITFDTSLANTGSGYAIAASGGAIPNTSYAKAMIFGPYHDVNIDYDAPNKRIEYRVEGVAPRRRFIYSFNEIPYFGGSCSSLFATHQLVLYESTGIIEVYIKDKPSCTDWNSGLTILGIQDDTRTKAVTAPGKNATVWGSNNMNEAYRFTPSGGASRFKRAELVRNGAVVALADTISGVAGELNLTFQNAGCATLDSTAYLMRVFYSLCNDPSQEVSYTDTVFVKRSLPAMSVSSLSANCGNGGSITTSLTNAGGTYQYSLNGGAFQASNVFSNVSPGNYVVTVQNGANCSFSNAVTVTLTNDLPLVVLPSDTAVCVGARFTPRVITNTAGNPSYAWSPSFGLSSSTQAQPQITAQNNAQYILTATLGPCVRKDTLNLTVFPGPQVSAGPDLTIISGDQIQLQATAPNPQGNTYLYTPATSLSSATVLNPLASPTQTTTYTLTATTAQGCVSTDQVVVTVLNCVEPMNAFTPNGDGVNDFWLVNRSGCFRTATVEVFNRYGHRVYRSDNYSNNWNGTFEGKPVPDGTYYYIVRYQLVNGQPREYKGNVTILR